MAIKDSLGRWGELYAAHILRHQGLEILERNVLSDVAEVDILALEDDCLIVCEVKTRRGNRAGCAAEAIDAKRLERLRLTAEQILCHHPSSANARVDGVFIDVTHKNISHHYVRGLS